MNIELDNETKSQIIETVRNDLFIALIEHGKKTLDIKSLRDEVKKEVKNELKGQLVQSLTNNFLSRNDVNELLNKSLANAEARINKSIALKIKNGIVVKFDDDMDGES